METTALARFVVDAAYPGTPLGLPLPFDWVQVSRAVEPVGCLSLIRHNCLNSGIELPAFIEDAWNHHWGRWHATRSVYLKELARILTTFHAEGLRPVPLKGPVLDLLVYGGFGLREFCDLDILLVDEEIGHALDILRRMGYVAPERAPDGYSIEGISRDVGGVSVDVELHRQLDFPWRGHQPTRELIDRAVPFGGIVNEGLRLCDEDLLISQSAHVHKDETEYRHSIRENGHRKLHPRLDVALVADLLISKGGIDWAQLFEVARYYRLEEGLRYGLAAARATWPGKLQALPDLRHMPHFIFAGEAIPWNFPWEHLFFAMGQTVPFVRHRVRDVLFRERRVPGECVCRWDLHELVRVSVPKAATASRWQLWVECDDDEHLYMEALGEIRNEAIESKSKRATMAIAGDWLTCDLSLLGWPVRLHSGRRLGLWSRQYDQRGVVLAEVRGVWAVGESESVS